MGSAIMEVASLLVQNSRLLERSKAIDFVGLFRFTIQVQNAGAILILKASIDPLLRNPDDEPDKKAESNEEASHEEKTSQAFIGCAAQTGRND